MATTAEALSRGPPFPARLPADANFWLSYLAVIWLAVLAGFGPELAGHITRNEAPYPIAVHVHAVVTLSWLGLLTSQILLIRRREVGLHRRWGTAGAFLAVGVVIVGLWAALAVEGRALATPRARPQFLAIEWSNIIEFAGLAGAAILARHHASSHKRLMLLATLSLTPAAFNRALGKPFIHPLLGTGVWETWVQIFAATAVMVIGIGLYDWLTRRRVHPVWAFGALWIVGGQVTASWLYYNPAWKAVATAILRAY
jgi:hypothetical protein